jgi:hypothetical protein
MGIHLDLCENTECTGCNIAQAVPVMAQAVPVSGQAPVYAEVVYATTSQVPPPKAPPWRQHDVLINHSPRVRLKVNRSE